MALETFTPLLSFAIKTKTPMAQSAVNTGCPMGFVISLKIMLGPWASGFPKYVMSSDKAYPKPAAAPIAAAYLLFGRDRGKTRATATTLKAFIISSTGGAKKTEPIHRFSPEKIGENTLT